MPDVATGLCCIPSNQFLSILNQLQEAIDSLSSFSKLQQEVSNSLPENWPKNSEYRQYHVPLYVLKEERELLDHYEAQNIPEVLHTIHNDILATVVLMKSYNAEISVSGASLCVIGNCLSRSLDMLDTAACVLSGYSLVHIMTHDS